MTTPMDILSWSNLPLPAFGSVRCPKCAAPGPATPTFHRIDHAFLDLNIDRFPIEPPDEFMVRTCACGFAWCEATANASIGAQS
jgi:hypothetical protein